MPHICALIWYPALYGLSLLSVWFVAFAFPNGNKLLQDGIHSKTCYLIFIEVDQSDWVIAILYKDFGTAFNEMKLGLKRNNFEILTSLQNVRQANMILMSKILYIFFTNVGDTDPPHQVLKKIPIVVIFTFSLNS